MLLHGYTKEMFRPKCNHQFQSVHCVARLEQDIAEALPYLNTTLGGSSYAVSPPALTLRVHGKLITLHSREIFINALKDEEEAHKICEWLKKEINETWEKRESISPTFQDRPKPQMMDVLKLLPKTNCGECGEPTCMVFALRAIEGVKATEDCPRIEQDSASKLRDYLGGFEFDL